jgi:hypothetical protein
MVQAQRLNLRLFIDGVEAPVIGARCTFAENTDAQADVEVIATDQVFDLLPRSIVHLFWYETTNLDHKTGRVVSGGPENTDSWKLLFAGEIAGVALQKTNSSRMAVINCVGPMNYLDFIRQHYINFSNGGVEAFENAFMGVNMGQVKNFDVVGKGVSSNLFVWLSASKVKVKNDDGTTESYSNIYTGTQRLLREMFFGSSIFYAQAFNRWRIGDMIVGLPEDKTAAQLMKLDFFQKFIQNRVGGGGGLVSARQMLDLLLGTVMHSTTTIPCPYFDPDGESLGLDLQTTDMGQQSVEGQPYPGGSLNYVVVKPDTWFLSPPACNIILPHQYSSLSFQRTHLAEPTRLMLRTSLFTTGRSKWLTERFYSPDFEAINQIMYQEGGHLDRMSSILLGHEEFVGLNPIFMWESDLGAYVQKGARREYLSNLSDYLFWKYRFSTRTMNLTGPFNPSLIPGYPALIMDRVGVPGQVTRHFMGNVQSLVHSIDQNGGETHVTFTGCYRHDESADYDNKGRTLNEVTRRGTDGFLDDRYDFDKIGDQVYRKLFGCGSLHDVMQYDESAADLIGSLDNYRDDIKEALGDSPDPVLRDVTYLQLIYQRLLAAEGDLGMFTRSLSGRPTASMTEVIGDPGVSGSEGFHSACVDPESSVSDSYTAVKTYTKTTRTRRPGEIIFAEDALGASRVKEVIQEGFDETKETVTSKETASYGLADMLKKRQAVVQAYVWSLRHRGLRG